MLLQHRTLAEDVLYKQQTTIEEKTQFDTEGRQQIGERRLETQPWLTLVFCLRPVLLLRFTQTQEQLESESLNLTMVSSYFRFTDMKKGVSNTR